MTDPHKSLIARMDAQNKIATDDRGIHYLCVPGGYLGADYLRAIADELDRRDFDLRMNTKEN